MSQNPYPFPTPTPGEASPGHLPLSTAANPTASTPAEGPLEAGVETALAQLESVALALEGRPEALLALLRSLEQLHRAIQDGPFRSSLPADRNALFQLLSEMERSGGWPYIPRLQLRTFLDLLGHGATVDGLAAAADGAPEPADTPRLAA